VKSIRYQLEASDSRAIEQIKMNLQLAPALVEKLRERFTVGTGELFAIALEELDISTLPNFNYATYCLGKTWYDAAKTATIPIGDRPIDGLILFFEDFLRQSDLGVVVAPNWMERRNSPRMSSESRETCLDASHVAYYGDEVYHVLTPKDTNRELIEDTIREPWHQWFVAICAIANLPENGEFSNSFLDELIASTNHIVVPAFDGEGFLVWSPTSQP
jgi:hypothetical protein